MKKHKAWATCSGLRNPAEYRKRSELTTESSVDKDFNFITNIERSITKTDQNISGRGITLTPAKNPRLDHRSKLDLDLEAINLHVIRAPKGLSRSKQNKTRWNGAINAVMWTVEWISNDGTKTLMNGEDSRLICDLYTKSAGKKSNKRKRTLSHSDSNAPSDPTGQVSDNVNDTSSEDVKPEDEKLRGLFFYLHHPLTTSNVKCLIPITKNNSLRSVLQNRTIIEFPTMYVLNQPPNQLSKGFMLQEDYEAQHGSNLPINISMPEEGEIHENTGLITSGIDPAKVLQVLAQDLSA